MVRKFPVTPVAAAVPANLPVRVLLALPEASSAQPRNPFFNLPGAINTLLGDWQRALKVINPRIWAPGWNSSQFRDFLYEGWPTPSSLPETGLEELRAESFLGLKGSDKPTGHDPSNYGVVHCVSGIALNWNRDPLLAIGNSRYSVGALRDALVRSGVKLLILQTFEKQTGLVEEQRLAEFVVGAGGPAVLIVAGGDQDTTLRYLQSDEGTAGCKPLWSPERNEAKPGVLGISTIAFWGSSQFSFNENQQKKTPLGSASE